MTENFPRRPVDRHSVRSLPPAWGLLLALLLLGPGIGREAKTARGQSDGPTGGDHPIVVEVEKKLKSPQRGQYRFRNFSNYDLFPGARTLHQGEAQWRRYFEVRQERKTASGRRLKLGGTGALPGDIVLLERRANDASPLVFVYLGEQSFPENGRQYSFFAYPYNYRGLEANTFPPRVGREHMLALELIKEDSTRIERGSAKGKQMKWTADERRGTTWLRRPPLKSGKRRTFFIPSKAWKAGATYVVLRARAEPVGTPPGVAGDASKPAGTEGPGPTTGLEFEPILVQEAGAAYREDQIVAHSRIKQPIQSAGRLHGRTRRHGDATPSTQDEVVKLLIDEALVRGLSAHDAAVIVAIARVESGFNPDAAAGTTSAAGLGQFVRRTGEAYGLTDSNCFDARVNARALVAHYEENKTLAANRGHKGADLDAMIYKYHHDGPSGEYGGLALAKQHVMPWIPRAEPLISAYLKRTGHTSKASGASPTGGVPPPGSFRLVVRPAPQPPKDNPGTTVNESLYESIFTLSSIDEKGTERVLGTFNGSTRPDSMQTHGRIKAGSYELRLGLHRRSDKHDNPLTPKAADLVAKLDGTLRPALIVDGDAPVPCVSDKPGKATMGPIHVHNGFGTGRYSEGCPTINPSQWQNFINVFLSRYKTLDDWTGAGGYAGRKVGALEVKEWK
jgi:hypothetical protein